MQWLYENIDLGRALINPDGVYMEPRTIPRIYYDSPQCPEGFPFLEVRKDDTGTDVEKLLDTDVFSVGIAPRGCKLRSLRIVVTLQFKVRYTGPRRSSFFLFYDHTIHHALNVLFKRILGQRNGAVQNLVGDKVKRNACLLERVTYPYSV